MPPSQKAAAMEVRDYMVDLRKHWQDEKTKKKEDQSSQQRPDPLPESKNGKTRASCNFDGDATNGEATALSVPNQEVAMLSDLNDSPPELLETDSEDDVWEGDHISAISCSDDDFEVEDLCWDHFGILKRDKEDSVRGSEAEASGSSLSEGLRSCLHKTPRNVGGEARRSARIREEEKRNIRD